MSVSFQDHLWLMDQAYEKAIEAYHTGEVPVGGSGCRLGREGSCQLRKYQRGM